MKQRIPGMVHIPLFIFLFIGFYETGKGFESLLGSVVAWGFAAGVTVIMYFLTFYIGNRRLNQQPILGLLGFYLVCSLFSYAGNFNGVYTEYQQEQLYREELLKHKEQLDDVLNASTKALQNFSPENAEKAVRVEQLTEQLYKQITDSARPGLGKRARELILEIEGVLGQKLTDLAGRTPQELADKYRENINEIAKAQFTAGDLGRVNGLIEENQQQAKEARQLMDDVLFADGATVRNIGAETNLKVVNTINNIGSKTQEFIKNPAKYKFEKVQFENQEVGKIAFSFKSGFTHHTLVAILLSIFCLFLDWAVVLFLIVRFRKGETAPYEQAKVKNVDL